MVVAEAAGIPETGPIQAARSLARGHDMACVVTLGARGAVAFGHDGDWEIPPLAIRPVDTTGAGDTFCGVLAAALDAEIRFPDALHRAGVAGALACTRAGAQTGMPSAAEIEAHLAGAPAVRRWVPTRQDGTSS